MRNNSRLELCISFSTRDPDKCPHSRAAAGKQDLVTTGSEETDTLSRVRNTFCSTGQLHGAHSAWEQLVSHRCQHNFRVCETKTFVEKFSSVCLCDKRFSLRKPLFHYLPQCSLAKTTLNPIGLRLHSPYCLATLYNTIALCPRRKTREEVRFVAQTNRPLADSDGLFFPFIACTSSV